MVQDLKPILTTIIVSYIGYKKPFQEQKPSEDTNSNPLGRAKYVNDVEVVQVGFIEYNEFVGIFSMDWLATME